MLLDDDCHSIDSPSMHCILENVKFPKLFPVVKIKFRFSGKGLSQVRSAMTQHSTTFKAEQKLSAEAFQNLVPSASSAPETVPPATKSTQKGGLRRLLMAGAAVAVLAGAA